VNGIPFVVIECKTPPINSIEKDPLVQAISQHLRNQRKKEIPHLYAYSQILLALHKNQAKYATTNTEKKFWSVWREENNTVEEKVKYLANKPLSKEARQSLFADRLNPLREYFQEIEASGREVWEQDRTLYALCRPERLLELAYRFIVYDASEKKIARYQQYFAVKSTLERIQIFEPEGNRRGGVIWHTQGSGKSLTMVMLAKSISLDKGIRNPRIVLVTDRTDLDDQIYKTFLACGKQPVKADSGDDLFKLVSEEKESIITTIINKFSNVIDKKGYRNDSSEIFVLVDEGHRTNYKELHQKMRKTLPKACYIAFTGTPLLKKDKNTARQFGGLIEPTYNIHRAVEDKAVVPILYEGRHVVQEVDQKPIDTWFEVVTRPLTPEQRVDLKRKFSSADQLNKADNKLKCIAYDISEHFRLNWQGTWAKAQLAADSKL
jgi:type I restriction enzyme, R subunit